MPLPARPRIVIAGNSGAGKSTLAASLSDKLELSYVEIDSLFHGEDWVPRDSFLEDVSAFVGRDSWIIEWQYESARPILAGRATTMVWLDYRWPVQMSRAIRRTARRRLTREELWNGNKEGPMRGVFTDKEHVIRWAWRTRHQHRGLGESLTRDYPHLDLVRLRSPRETQRWIRSL